MKFFLQIFRIFFSLFKKPVSTPEIRSEARDAIDLYASRGIIMHKGPEIRWVLRSGTRLKVGDRVYWVSKSRGKETELAGEVVLVLPAGETKEDGLAKFPDHDHSRAGHGDPRDHVSYFVEVHLHDRARPFIYHPRVSSLFLVV